MDKHPDSSGKSALPAPREGYVGFQITGKNPSTWINFREKFVARIEQLVELVQSDDPAACWFREQAGAFRDLAVDHLKAKLRKEGLEVERIEGEVAKLFAESEKVRAEARKLTAEARTIELKNGLIELRASIGMTRAMLIGERGREAAVFGRQLDAMLEALKVVAESEEMA